MKLIQRGILCAILCVAVLAGCASPPKISSAPVNPVASVVASDATIATGLQNAAYNFDQAVAIGVLAADDPAAPCLHSALQLAGLEPLAGAPAVQSFTPKVTDLISAGSVLYIQAKQLQGAKPFEASTSCKAIVGDVVLQALKAGFTGATSAIPGAGPLLSVIRGK